MTDRIRVLWLIKGLGAGGAETLLVSAARVSDRQRFDLQAAYVVARKDALVPALHAQGVSTTCLGRSTSGAPWPLALRRLLRRGRFDVLHLHSPLVAGVARFVVRTLPPSSRPVVMSTEHNSWASYSRLTRLVNAALHATDAQRWAVSARVRNSVWRPLRSSVQVLVHGIVHQDTEVGVDRHEKRAALGLSPEDVVGITVANFRAEKAYPDLLRAIRKALDQEPRLRFLIVGQGPLESEVRVLHDRLGLGERCQILGYRTDVMSLLAVSDIFILSSKYEGFPIALMEAMATGLAVVVTNVGGVADCVVDGQEGLVVEPGRPDDLGDAIVRVASDAELRAGMAARARVAAQQFDITTAVRTVEAAYASTIGRRR